MNLELINKTALISGSTKGIGFSVASQLAAQGAEKFGLHVPGHLVAASKGPARTDMPVEITGREVSALWLGCLGMSWGYRPADEKESLNGTPSTSREQQE